MRDSGTLPGLPTTSARTRRGTWALYYDGGEVLVVHPGGRLAGAPAEVAAELDRLAAQRDLDELDRKAASAIRSMFTGDGPPLGRRVATWFVPALGYWLSGPSNDPEASGPASKWTRSLARIRRSRRCRSIPPLTI